MGLIINSGTQDFKVMMIIAMNTIIDKTVIIALSS